MGGGAEPLQGGRVGTGLPLPGQHPGREAPGGPTPPPACEEADGALGSPCETSSFWTKGSAAPQPRDRGMRLAEPGHRVPQGLPKCRRGVEQRPGRALRAAAQASPSTRPRPRVTWVLPGVGGGGGRGVSEDAGVTLRAAPRPEAAAPVLGRSHGPGAGASWREPRGIRASEAAKVTAEGAGGGVFLKSKMKKAPEREGAGGPRWGHETIASRPQPSASLRAASRCYLFVFIPILQSVFQEKKKLNQEIKTFSCQCLVRAWGRG